MCEDDVWLYAMQDTRTLVYFLSRALPYRELVSAIGCVI